MHDLGWQDKGLHVAIGAEHVYCLVRYGNIFFSLIFERRLYRGKPLVEVVSLIVHEFVAAHIDVYIAKTFLGRFVVIKGFFIHSLFDVRRINDLVTEERNGVKVAAKSKCAFANRRHLIGYGYVFQLFAVIECIVTDCCD